MIPCVEYSGKTMRSMPWLELGSGLGLGSGTASTSGVRLGRGYRQALLGALDELADARDVVHDLGVGVQPRHLVLEDAHACVITSGPLHCGLRATHTAGNNDGQKGDKRRQGARECRTHGRLVRNMPQRHFVRPGARRCKLARRDCVCSRGATQKRAPTVPEHRRCLATVSETSPCSETVHPRTPSTLALASHRRCQGWKRCLRDGSWRSLGYVGCRKDAATHHLGAHRGDKIVRRVNFGRRAVSRADRLIKSEEMLEP